MDLDKLDLLGKFWLIEYCIYRYNERQRRLAYEIYVTDRLKAINASIAQTFGGTSATKRFVEVLDMMKHSKEPERTAEQVISSISDKLERLGNESI